MSLSYRTFDEYRSAAADHLDAVLASRRDEECESVLAHAFLLYSYTIEDLAAKTTKNKEVLDRIAVMFLVVQDVLRSIVHGMRELTPVGLGTLLRVAFEVRCNLALMFQSTDPVLLADRYRRFGDLLTLAHDEQKPPNQRLLSKERREEILKASSEWVSRKKDGSLHFSHNWTADKNLKSVRLRADAAGLGSLFDGSYAAMSQFTHASARVAAGYREGSGLGPIGQTASCRGTAMLAVFSCMDVLRDAVTFFGWPFDESEYSRWRLRALPVIERGLPPSK